MPWWPWHYRKAETQWNIKAEVKQYLYTGLDRPLGFQEVEAARRQLAHEGRKVVSPAHLLHFGKLLQPAYFHGDIMYNFQCCHKCWQMAQVDNFINLQHQTNSDQQIRHLNYNREWVKYIPTCVKMGRNKLSCGLQSQLRPAFSFTKIHV